MNFANEIEALQYLSDITGKKVIVANEIAGLEYDNTKNGVRIDISASIPSDSQGSSGLSGVVDMISRLEDKEKRAKTWLAKIGLGNLSDREDFVNEGNDGRIHFTISLEQDGMTEAEVNEVAKQLEHHGVSKLDLGKFGQK